MANDRPRRVRPHPIMDRTPLRREKLARALKADQADAFLVTSTTNVRYLTGFSGEDAALLVARKRAVIVSDGRFTTQLEQECPGLEARIRPIHQTLIGAVVEAIGALGVRRLAFEA